MTPDEITFVCIECGTKTLPQHISRSAQFQLFPQPPPHPWVTDNVYVQFKKNGAAHTVTLPFCTNGCRLTWWQRQTPAQNLQAHLQGVAVIP